MVGGAGAEVLLTCCVMSASARRGERRGESGAGRGERVFRLEGGGSPVDTDDERRFILVVVNNDKRCLMDGIVSYISAADVWWPYEQADVRQQMHSGQPIHQRADVRVFFPYIVDAGSCLRSVMATLSCNQCVCALRVDRTQSVKDLTAPSPPPIVVGLMVSSPSFPLAH